MPLPQDPSIESPRPKGPRDGRRLEIVAGLTRACEPPDTAETQEQDQEQCERHLPLPWKEGADGRYGDGEFLTSPMAQQVLMASKLELTEADTQYVYISRLLNDSKAVCGFCRDEILDRLAMSTNPPSACAAGAGGLTLDRAFITDLRRRDPAGVRGIELQVQLETVRDPRWWADTFVHNWLARLADQNAVPYLWQTRLFCAVMGRYTIIDLYEGRRLSDPSGSPASGIEVAQNDSDRDDHTFLRHHARRISASADPLYRHAINTVAHAFPCKCPPEQWRCSHSCTDALWSLTWLDTRIRDVLFSRCGRLPPAAPGRTDSDIIELTARLWALPEVQADLGRLKDFGAETKEREARALQALVEAADVPTSLRPGGW